MTISTITLDWSSRDGDSACFKHFVEFGKKLNLTSKDVFFKMLVGNAINNAIEINYIVHFLALRGSLFNGTELNTDLILRNICRLRIYTCSKIKLNNSPAPISFGNTLHVDSGDTYSMEENTILKNNLKIIEKEMTEKLEKEKHKFEQELHNNNNPSDLRRGTRSALSKAFAYT